jgi:Tol biopolymer transport system component/predicted Ser/Thr protein kinase
MTLAPGTRLGPYEISAPVGAGGMGEVYRAKDTRLDRTVAVKILPSHLAESPELRQRFEREARAISALNHPHICMLHDVGQQDGIAFLVMEYLEGETLADRLKKGALPLDHALRYGIEIADALDRAHRQGIVHRDLKPGNVMITKSGTKLLDFGLAKLRSVETSRPAGSTLSAMTTEERPLTTEGSVVGTVPYMAPEQLEGREPDARTDIFALGTVLYEMLTAQRAFTGKSQASLMAAILNSEPTPVSVLKPLTPPALDRVVGQCLAKDPDDRWQSAHDLASELKWLAEGRLQADAPGPVAARGKRREWLAWGVAAALAIVASVLARRSPDATPAAAPAVTAALLPPAGVEYAFDSEQGPPALSPDGQRLAFVGVRRDGAQTLWVRELSRPTAQEVADTAGASYPFWSPDNRRVGYFARGRLNTIEASGGAARTLCDAPYPRGGSWGPGDVILFAGQWQAIQRVSATGGAPVAVTELGVEVSHRFPQFLSDGQHFLYIGFPFTRGIGETTVYVGRLGSSDSRILLKASGNALYAPPGWVLFWRERALVAQRLDLEKFALEGEPIPLVEPVRALLTTSGSTIASVSANQALVYQEGLSGAHTQFGWFDRGGRPLGNLGAPGDRLRPRISHDGRRLAADVLDPQQSGPSRDIWLFDLGRDLETRLTFETGNERWPAWSPDDRRLVYSSHDSAGPVVYQKPTTGTGAAEVLFRMDINHLPTDWSADGRFLALQSLIPGTKTTWDVWTYSFEEKAARPFVQTVYAETGATFSPDGKWLAYASDESGRFEVYVQPFPGPGSKSRISTASGVQPRWRADGRELFYRELDGRFMAVPVTAARDGAFEAGTPQLLFELRANPTPGTQYDVTGDGQRFIVSVPVRAEGASPLTLVLNWPALLHR